MDIDSEIVLTKIKNTKLNLAPLSKGIIWVNPLALELDIYNLAHHLCTM